METHLSVDVGKVIVHHGLGAVVLGDAPHRVAQPFNGLTAQDLILGREVIIFGRPGDIHRVLWQLVDVGVLGQDLLRSGELRLGLPVLPLPLPKFGFEEDMGLNNVDRGLFRAQV